MVYSIKPEAKSLLEYDFDEQSILNDYRLPQ